MIRSVLVSINISLLRICSSFGTKRSFGTTDDVGRWYALFCSQTIGSDGGGNNGIHLQPSRDFQGNVYQFASGLGNPFEKYAKCDYRVIPFHTTDAKGGYEGFFLQGAQMKYDESKQYGFTDENVNGSEEWMGFPLVFVDQVGRFQKISR